jgi:hypothetical protein
MASKKKKRAYEDKIRHGMSDIKCKIHDKGVENPIFKWYETIEDGSLRDKITVVYDPCCDDFDKKAFAKLEKEFGVKKAN